MKLNAQSFRWVLASIIILAVALSSAAFYIALGSLKAFSSETTSLNQESSLADAKIDSLDAATTYIDQHPDALQQVRSITSNQEKFQYQDDIIQNISNMADSSNLTIERIVFNDTASPEVGTIEGTAQQATPGETTVSDTSVVIPGFSPRTAQIELTDSSYQDLLNFMYKVENNTLKMYIANLSLSSDSTGSRKITKPTFELTIFVKDGKG